MEKRRKRKLPLLFLAVCAMLLLPAGRVSAKDIYKSIPLKQNKTVKQKANMYTTGKTYYYRYKISVPGDGYITFDLKKNGHSSISFSLFHGLKDTDEFYWFSSSRKKERLLIPVSKGSFYVSDHEKNGIRWKFTRVKAGSNYSPEKASALQAGKKVKICQTPDYNFSRWYKITLRKKQPVTFWAEKGEQVKIYDEDFTNYSVEHAGSGSLKYFTSNSLEPGTYYLCMNREDWHNSYEYEFYYTTLCWK